MSNAIDRLEELEGRATGGPWTTHCFTQHEPEEAALMKKHGIKPAPVMSNDGERYIMGPESADGRTRIALVDPRTHFKRGKGYGHECAERDANAALISALRNASKPLLAVVRAGERYIEALDTGDPNDHAHHEEALRLALATLKEMPL